MSEVMPGSFSIPSALYPWVVVRV